MAKRNQKDPLVQAVLGKPKEATQSEVEGILEESTGAVRHRSTVEETEYRRLQVHRLVLRGVPAKTIAQHLGVSIHTVYADTKFINARIKRDVQEMDYPLYIGKSISFYDECRNIALRMATDTNEKSTMAKLSALQAALKAEDSKNNFLGKLGLYKSVNPTDPFSGLNTGKESTHSDSNDIDSFLAVARLASKGAIDLAVRENPEGVINGDDYQEHEDIEE